VAPEEIVIDSVAAQKARVIRDGFAFKKQGTLEIEVYPVDAATADLAEEAMAFLNDPEAPRMLSYGQDGFCIRGLKSTSPIYWDRSAYRLALKKWSLLGQTTNGSTRRMCAGPKSSGHKNYPVRRDQYRQRAAGLAAANAPRIVLADDGRPSFSSLCNFGGRASHSSQAFAPVDDEDDEADDEAGPSPMAVDAVEEAAPRVSFSALLFHRR